MFFWKRGRNEQVEGVHGRHDKEILASFYGSNYYSQTTKKLHKKVSNIINTPAILKWGKGKGIARNDDWEQERERSRYSSIDNNTRSPVSAVAKQAVNSRILAPNVQPSFIGVCDDDGVYTEYGSGNVHRCYSFSQRAHDRGQGPPAHSQQDSLHNISGVWSSDESPSALTRKAFLKAKGYSEGGREQSDWGVQLSDSRDDDTSISGVPDVVYSPSTSEKSKSLYVLRISPSHKKQKQKQQVLAKTEKYAEKQKAPQGPREPVWNAGVLGNLADDLSSNGDQYLVYSPSISDKEDDNILNPSERTTSPSTKREFLKGGETSKGDRVPVFDLDPDDMSREDDDVVYSPSNSEKAKDVDYFIGYDQRDARLVETPYESQAPNDKAGSCSFCGSLFGFGPVDI
jgi:hypothetical protein